MRKCVRVCVAVVLTMVCNIANAAELDLKWPGSSVFLFNTQVSVKSLTLAQAEIPETAEDPERVGIVRKATVYVDDAQRVASERFGNFMGRVDGFFSKAGSNEDAVSNRSWARIRLDAKRPADGELKIRSSLKVRLVLPETERRFKLLLSTEGDDNELGGENAEPGQGDGSTTEGNASAAIRFIRSARSNGSINLDVGVRKRDSEVQFFTRLNTGYRGTIGDTWNTSVTNSYYYYNESGFEDRLSFDFRRVLITRNDLYFRTFTEFNWLKGRPGAVISQTLGLYTQFGNTKSLAFEALAGYHTAISEGVDDRFRGHELRFRWRHNVWRPWFFYEFWPSVSWPSTNEYERSYGALLRAEVVVGQR